MEKILTLNSGQHVLLGFTITALQGRYNRILSISETMELIDLVIDLTDPEHYQDDHKECPDYKIMIYPQEAFETFCEWFDENENYFVNLVS